MTARAGHMGPPQRAMHLPRGVELTELDPAFRHDPHTRLDRVRHEQPVYWDEDFQQFFLTDYETVRRVLTDRSFLRDPDRADPSARSARSARPGARSTRGAETRIGGMAQMDDPDHGRIRSVFAAALNARMSRAEPLVRAVVARHLQALPAGRFDLISDYATPIPSDVIARVLAGEESDLSKFRTWSEALIQIFDPMRSPAQTRAIAQARLGFARFLRGVMRERRMRPQDDLVSDLVRLQADGAPLSDAEIDLNCQTLMVAGNLTTADLIGNAVWLLLRHPQELAELRADPNVISAVLEESLRLEPPVNITVRIAPQDIELGGCPIAAGQALTLSLQAAHRDPRVYETPERFTIHRPGRPHMAFGGGAHICLGQPLARLEARLAILGLLDRYPNLALAAPEAPAQWRALPYFHGLQVLEVRP
jgi:cytochrome P450